MAGSRSVRVNLDFTATTSQAESALSRLNGLLRNIGSQTNLDTGGFRLPEQLNNASTAAITLRQNLANAINVDTGKLDLSKFNKEMAKSGMSLEQYRVALGSIGPTGREAFMDLSKAILASETPLKQSNVLVDKLWDSLKRTAGWQLSSTAIHAFTGAISTAYNYAQDLNKSLNDIRIVTGYGSDRMAEFAKNANKAAKELSATTLDYTNASLIYYQQGLGDEAVQARTDTTVKMANVTGTTASVVSDQLTAVWENFMKDGKHTAEWYADVMTALGAATASSTDEIADGLEKFAAVADTVGLSYEYATAALTTITAKTRQSADVVGTALKTLFARIEGLNLGETLDDGTTLNKYSSALDAVGVNIKDSSGELKDMDTILDEIGSKWSSIGKDQQIALAQTVAGVRQYTQFVALMDNWDFMKENLDTVANATGTLDEQAEIYAESWEAAQKRVQAAAEGIYQDLLDDDFFITLTDGFADILNFLDKMIDSVGGLGGVLPGVIILMNKLFGDKIANGASVMVHNLMNLTAAGRQANMAKDTQTYEQVLNLQRAINPNLGLAENNEATAVQAAGQQVLKVQKAILEAKGKITEEDRKQYQMLIESIQQQGEKLQQQAKELDLLQRTTREQSNEIMSHAELGGIYGELSGTGSASTRNMLNEYLHGTAAEELTIPTTATAQNGVINQLNTLLSQSGSSLSLELKDLLNTTDEFKLALTTLSAEPIREFTEAFNGLGDSIKSDAEALAHYETQITDLNALRQTLSDYQGPDGEFDLDKYKEQFRTLGYTISDTATREQFLTEVTLAQNQATERHRQALEGNNEAIREFANRYGLAIEEVQVFADGIRRSTAETTRQTKQMQHFKEGVNSAAAAVGNANKTMSKINGLQNFANNLMSLQMGFMSLKTFVSTLTDESATVGDKIMTLLSALTFGIGGVFVPLTSGLKSLGAALRSYAAAEIVAEAATSFSNKAKSRKIILENQAKIATILSANASKELTAAELAEKLAEAGIGTEKTRMAIAQALLNKEKGKGVIAATLNTLANKLENKAVQSENVSLGINIALWIAKKLAALGAVGAIMAVVGAVAILTGAVVGLIALVNNIKNNSFSGQLEGLTEESENAAKAAEEATNKFQELKDAISDYEEGVKNLANLTKGTQEFEEALEDANETAKELIKNYDIKNWRIDPDTGLIQIDSEELEAAQEKAKSEKVRTQQTASAISAARTELQIEKDVQDLSDRYGVQEVTSNGMVYTSAGSVSDMNKLIAAIEGFDGGADLFFEDVKENVAKALGWNVEQLTSYQEEFIRNIQNDSDAFQEHIQAIQTDKGAIEGDRKDSMLVAFQSNVEDFTSSSQQKEIVDAVYAQSEEEIEAKAKTKYNNMSGDALYKAYAELQGYSDYDDGINILDGKEVFYDENGEEVAKVSDTVMRKALREAEVQKQLGLQTDTANTLVGMELSGNDMQSAIAKMATTQGDWDSGIRRLSEEELRAFAEMSDDEKESYQNLFDSLEINLSEAIKAAQEPEAADIQAEGAEKRRSEEVKNIADTYGLSEELIESQVEALQEQEEAYERNKDAAIQATKEQLRLQTAGTALNKVWKDNYKAIEKWTQGLDDSIETQQAVLELQDALNEMFNTKVSTDFIKKNFDVIKSAMEGDTEAVRRFQDLAAQDVLLNVTHTTDFNSLDNELQELHNQILDYAAYSDFTVGAKIDDANFKATCQALVAAAGMTADQAQEYFKSMGFDVEFDTTSQTNQQKYTYHKLDVEKTKQAGGMPQFEDAVTTIEATTETMGTAIKTITPNGSAGGNIDLTNTKYNGGSGGSSSGGGGGGGSQKDKKKSSDEIERYHVVKKQLDNLSREYDNLSAAKDRAFGANRLRVMDQEIAKLDEQIAKQKQYVNEINSYYAQDRAAIAVYGAVFDEDGIITNYEQIVQRQLDIFNGALTDEAEEAYNDFKDALDQYEETLELKLSEADVLVEKEYEKLSLQLDKLDYQVEINVQIHDDDIEFLERRLTRLERAERKIFDQQAARQEKLYSLQQKYVATQSGYWSLLQMIAEREAQGLEITDDMNEKLREYKENLLDINDEIDEMQFDIIDSIGTAFEDYFDELDDYIDRISTLSDMLETTRDTLDLLGYSNLDSYNEQTTISLASQNKLLDTQLKKLSARNEEIAYWQKLQEEFSNYSFAEAQEAAKNFSDVTLQKTILAADSLEAVQEAIAEKTREAMQAQLESQEDIQSSINDIVSAIEDGWVGAIEKVVAAQKKNLLGDIDYMVDRYSDLVDMNELYLSESKKNYELNKLNRTILRDIEKTDNVAAKAKMRDILEEVNALQASNAQLSEYELKTLQARYDLRVAEIALEEAQQAKSQVRLVRDNEGNWGYMYTADSEEVSKAQQKVEDKMQALQELQEETMRDAGEKILQIQQEYYDALEEIYTDTSLTEAEKAIRADNLLSQTSKELQYYTDQYDKALKESGVTFQETILGQMYPGFSTLDEFNSNFAASAKETFDMIGKQYEQTRQYYIDLAELMGVTDAESLQSIEELKNAIAAAQLVAQKNMADAMKTSSESFDEVASKIGELVTEIDSLVDSLREWIKTVNEIVNISTTQIDPNRDYFGEAISAMQRGDMESAKQLMWYRGLKVAQDPDKYGKYSWGSQKEMQEDFAAKGAPITDAQAAELWKAYTQKAQSFATGGYTGEWGTEGRWAVLHQKELVLNADDTDNMLAVIGAVHDIIKQVDMQALYSRDRGFTPLSIGTRADTLEQNVHIDASFPNVQSHQEIEQAFENLVNLASQYANKK